MKNEAIALVFLLPLIQTVWFRPKFQESVRWFWGLLLGYALIAFIPNFLTLYGFLGIVLVLELLSAAAGKWPGTFLEKDRAISFYRLSFIFGFALHYFNAGEIMESLLSVWLSAILFPVLTAFYERLKIEKTPTAIEGLPFFLFLCGLLLLFFSSFFLFSS